MSLYLGLYVAYEDGVYRHETIAVQSMEKDIFPKVLDYFKNTDDYHDITVEYLGDGDKTKRICVYSVRSERKGFSKGGYTGYSAIHGKRIVHKDGVKFMEFIQEYKLEDGEEWISET